MSKKTFKLKDESTCFFDPETDLNVVRSNEVVIDVEGGGAGALTLRAIQYGALIEVNRSSKSDTSDSDDKSSSAARKKTKG